MGAKELMNRLRAEAERRGLVPEKQPQAQPEPSAKTKDRAPARDRQAARTAEATNSPQFRQAVEGIKSGSDAREVTSSQQHAPRDTPGVNRYAAQGGKPPAHYEQTRPLDAKDAQKPDKAAPAQTPQKQQHEPER